MKNIYNQGNFSGSLGYSKWATSKKDISKVIRVSNLWTIINWDNERRRCKFLGGVRGMLPQKILKIGSLKTPFSALRPKYVAKWHWKLGMFFLLLLPKKVVIDNSTYTP